VVAASWGRVAKTVEERAAARRVAALEGEEGTAGRLAASWAARRVE
jgi:hypothetical protein